jgi:hypothetical protein
MELKPPVDIASRELNSPSRVSKLENLAWKQEAEKVTKS